MIPAPRPREVDEPASGQTGQEALFDFTVELTPRRVTYRSVLAQEMVHRAAPFRLPMPSEPDSPGPASSPPDSASVSISMIDPDVKRYVRR